MTDNERPTMDFDRGRVVRLSKVYRAMQEKGVDTFEFDGRTLVTAYAYYMLQYLRPQFNLPVSDDLLPAPKKQL